ncbi:eukaryotic translation initiation factor 4G-like isoform X1 [Actinidia eriantha]|uniref:eukaryotic translation initiation factor 4G-like isoform X1 n=1 Tax=Actinidia eriantha TaxID=165200 RepID=UPI00258458DF|nr:eukaryotic translation initiation factor 4G-like isoform X1 [Actinidia eriantha]XP_057499099.1 eukaryotic translation initiation factor 4G-like isoform X1 [Actinidia eriantha]
MSFNQSRAERSDSSQYKKWNRSGSSAQPRNFSGGGRKGGGGTAPPPSSTYSNDRSFKKPDNAQGGQSRVPGARENLDSNYASAVRTLQNGSHLQPPVHGAADTPVAGVAVKPTTDMSTRKIIQAVPKAPFSQSATVNSGSTSPATPEKASGDASKSSALQFGSISPGFMNGMQIPARTSSAPPNLDEQQRDQARHDSLRTMPTFPIPSVPRKQVPRKDGGVGDQANTGESHQMSKAKRAVHVSSASPVTQTQKASVHHMPGGSMPMPFNQQQIPGQFGGPIPQIQSQGMAMPMPLPMGNAPQLQQPIFVSSLQPHPLHPQGIMPQSQGLNFTPQMGAHLPPQLGNLGISSGPQFAAHQAGKLGVLRKPVKITHPDTHEELRLDGSSGPRSHPNVPQSQPITSVPPAHPINYYPNTYNPNSLFFPAPSSVPLTSTQINPNSQAARFSYSVSQGPQTVPFMNSSSHNSYASKNSVPLHGIPEPSSLEHSRDVRHAVSSAPSASVQVTVKPAIGLHVEKVADSLQATSSASVEKGESPEFFKQPGEASSIHLQRGSEALQESSTQQPKPSLETRSTSLGKKSNASSHFSVEGTVPNSLSSSPPPPLEKSVPAVTDSAENRREAISGSESFQNQQKKQIREGLSQPQHQIPGQSTSMSSLPSQSLEDNNSFNTGSTEAIASPSSNTRAGMVKSTRELSSTHTAATTSAPEIKTDSDGRCSTCQSPRMLGASALIDSLDIDHYASENDSSLVDEPLKLETMRIKEQGVMFNEGPKQDKLGSKTSPGVVSIKSLAVVDQTEANSVTKLTTNSHDVQSPELVEKDLEEPVIHRKIDDGVADNLVISTSPVLDDTAAKTSSSKPSSSTSSNGENNGSISDATCTRSDSLGSGQVVVTKSILSDEGETPVSISSVSEPTLKSEGEGTEDVNTGLVSLPAAGSKDNPMLDLTRSKSTGSKGKKKLKEILQKADAAGTTSDLYMAYKGPEEKKETAASSESITSSSSINLKQVLVDTAQDDVSGEKAGQSKAEPDDWEDAADISAPKLETGNDGNNIHGGLKHHDEDGSGVIAKKYSRDFLMKFSEQCTDLPEGFEITTDLEALMVSNVNTFHESSPSPGIIIDRPSRLSRSDRRGSGMGDDDKWSKFTDPLVTGRDPRMDAYGGNFRFGQGGNFGVLRTPRAQTHVQYAGGILSGPMQTLGSQGGIQRNNSDSDRWQRATSFQKGLIPSPQTPSQVIHKAEKKYEVGKITDEEQAKQRQLKAILNKLTPQNFEKLFEQVKAVNIDSAITLTGVISQIFDKALMEPTFCEMYANFCYHLAGALPDFSDDNEKITFKRLLLNKCQEEFERGEREQEEADRADEEGEVKQSEEEREEKRIQARRRMLGNIRLIGELYKKRMLTERIMHECIQKLLGQDQNPDEENIEALCKLMSTIGEMIDHSKAKEHMDAYFGTMANLSNNMKLSSRVRFMLKDSIDLRKNKWQQRRKVEGPKKIEEVHRDAAQERQVQAGRLARGPSINSSVRNRQTMDFGARGSSMLPSPNAQMGSLRGLPAQLRGYGTQDSRMDERHSFENRILSVPLPQRPIVEDSITLGPQGGLARGMSNRGQPSMPNTPITEAPRPVDSRRMTTGLNGYSSVSDHTGHGSREDLLPRCIPDRFVGPSHDQSSIQGRNVNFGNRDQRHADRNIDRSLPTSPTIHGREQTSAQNISSDKVWPEELLRDMSIAAIKEFYSAKDEKEVGRCVKDLNAPSFYPTMISIWVTDSFERKDMERDLLAKLLINLSKSQDGMLSEDHLIEGFESVLGTLEDAINDAPKAGEFLGRIFAKIVVENVMSFTEIGQLIYNGGEEQGSLVEMGLAAEVVGTILETIKSEKGESVLNDIRTSSSLKIEKFRPPGTKKSLRLDMFI